MDAVVITDAQRTRLLSILHKSPVYKEKLDENKAAMEHDFIGILTYSFADFFEQGVEWYVPSEADNKAAWQFGRGCAALSEDDIEIRECIYGDGAGKMLRDETTLWRNAEAHKDAGLRKRGTAPWKRVLCARLHPICGVFQFSFKEHESSDAVKLIRILCDIAKVPINKSTPIHMVRVRKAYKAPIEAAKKELEYK